MDRLQKLAEQLGVNCTKVNDTHATFFCSEKDDILQIELHIDTYISDRAKMMGTHSVAMQCALSEERKMAVYTVDFKPFEELKQDPNHAKLIERVGKGLVPVYDVQPNAKGEMEVSVAIMADRPSIVARFSRLMEHVPYTAVTKKAMQSYPNGVQVYSMTISGATKESVEKAVMLVHFLPQGPQNAIMQLYFRRVFTGYEVIYAHALIIFAYYFTPPPVLEDYNELAREVGTHPLAMKRLQSLRKKMFQQMMSERYITGVLASKPELLKALYADFEAGSPAASLKKLVEVVESGTRHSAVEHLIFQTFVTFNRSCLKTNFYKLNKAAVAYRFDPNFMVNLDYARIPFGIFIIVGPCFRGFHVRFTDIARGGVRLIKLQNLQEYTKRKRNLFLENYSLAEAQLLKNKDIPEGGSKGTILVSIRQKAYSESIQRTMFLQYIDALLDLTLPPKDGVRDKTTQEEILFLGPDENTAGDYPTIGAFHAKARGHKHWKSFTTGKEPSLGGIPHDVYGVTTRGVRAYMNAVYEKLGLPVMGEGLTKFQTGGPDGDLGSNEIKMSKETYIALVDGSGVLCDPKGLNRDELVRLAKARTTVEKYDRTKLSPNGFFVGVSEHNRTLPDGTVVPNGRIFRNDFHFSPYARADTFVPCGGRPASVTLENVHKFVIGLETTGEAMLEGRVGNLARSGRLRFKYITEGANLFITHDARLALEKVGVVLVKDSSANKGGVSSSSLEVLAGLALNDAEYRELMCEKNGVLPEFYQKYVAGILLWVHMNARREFDCLWSESRQGRCGGLITLASDELSTKIVNMRKYIYDSNLFENKKMVRYVLKNFVPPALLEVVPLDTLMQRVPQNYLRAVFAIWLASNFVYSIGLDANEFSFFQYMIPLVKAADAL